MIRTAFCGALLAAITGSALAQTLPPFDTPGRLLASNCFQCHGTNGRNGAWDQLAGKSANELLEKLREMKTERVGNDIMKQHARGYTDAQLQLIADYLSKLPR